MIKLLCLRRKKVLVPGELKCTFVIELVNQEFKEESYGDHDNENEIDKDFNELCDTIKDDMNL